MRERFQPRQSQKPARSLDRVHQPENVIQDLGVVRFLLEPNQLIIDGVQALASLRQKFTQQIIHETGLERTGAPRRHAFQNGASFSAKRLILVEQMEKNGLTNEIRRPPAIRGYP